jgi:dihydrofolate reductase
MKISLIAAIDQRGGIGKNGQLPWHLTDDLKNFRRLTMGHHALMGRKTYDSFGGQMPGRKLIVLSRNSEFRPADAQVVLSLDAGIQLARVADEAELFIIGGAQVFAQALPLADRFYLTRVHTDADCDVFFPQFDEAQWTVVEQKNFVAGGKNQHDFKLVTLERSS